MQKLLYNGRCRNVGNFLQRLIYTLLDIQKVLLKFVAVRSQWIQTDQQLVKELFTIKRTKLFWYLTNSTDQIHFGCNHGSPSNLLCAQNCLRSTNEFKVCKSVHYRTIQINHQPDATIFQFIILMFLYSSTCFGRFPAHHQELNDCIGSLWFYLPIVVRRSTFDSISNF